MFKISIVVPIYNTEKYLIECIESVLNQSYQNIEIILVNDGSPGNAQEICDEYVKKDSRIKYFSKQNEGCAIARNLGISKATGDYVFCMDSDDTIEIDFVKKIVYIIAETQAEFVITGDFCKKPIEIIGALPTWAFVVKKSLLDKYSNVRFIEGLQPCEDGLFSHKLLALTKKIAKCPDAIYNYRQHTDSSEHSLQTQKIIHDMPVWFNILEKFYDDYNLWEAHKLHLLAFIENEPFSLRFCKMNFTDEERKFIFDLIHNFIEKHNLLNCKDIKLFKKKYRKFLKQNNYYSYQITTKDIVNNKIIKLIQQNNIISFDIFDTLLIRPYINPYHLLDHIERYTGSIGFAKNRYEAEGKARSNSDKEDIKFDEIYDFVDDKYKHLKETELQFEYTLLKQNSHVFDVYKYARSLGKKIVFISDMYLPKDFLAKVLNKNGYDYYDDFYLSGEVGLAKYSGNLFKKFLEDNKIKPSSVLHIGDSLISDIKKPKKLGINTYHIPKISDVFFENKNNQKFATLCKQDPNNLEISIILAILAEKFIYYPGLLQNKHNYMRDFGYCIAGPIGFGFVKFILDEARRNNYEQLLFVARDGYILKKIAEILSDNLKTFYVYAQRILRSRMLLNYGDEHNADLLLSVLDEQISRNTDLKTFKEKKEYIDNNVKKLEDYANTKKREYYKYLLHQGIDNQKSTAVIDTGAATFSAQLLLENALNKKLQGLYTIITNPEYAIENNISYTTWSSPEDIKNITSMIEFCFTSPELPVVDICKDKPVYISNPRPEELHRNLLYPELSQGIIDFTQDIHNRLGNLEIVFYGKDVNKYIRSFCENLSSVDKKALTKVRSSSNASHTEYKHKFIKQISVSKRKYSFIKYIFSINNEYKNNTKRKVITLFGIKIKLKITKEKRFKKLLSKIQIFLWKLFPLNKKMVIFWDGVTCNGFGDSIKPIYYIMKKLHPEFRYVFIVNNRDMQVNFPIKEKVIKAGSKMYKYLCTAKYYVTNMYPLDFKYRKGQLWVSTGHGTPLKTIGFLDKNLIRTPDKERYKIMKKISTLNIKIAQSEFSKKYHIISYAFKNGDILRAERENKFYTLGSSRNDILFNYTEDYVTSIREKLKIPKGKRIILYAPTYRQTGNKYIAEMPLDIDKMKEALGDEYVFLIRAHYFIRKFITLTGKEIEFNNQFFLNVSMYPDISDLYLLSDILITDYSSSPCDYACLKRPMIFYCYDYDHYEKTRGFNIDFKAEMPGPIVYNSEELIDSIKHVSKDKDKYVEKYEAFYKKYCSIEDGHASERIVNIMLNF